MKKLYYGKSCKHGHHQEDGTNVRGILSNYCHACTKKLPPGLVPTIPNCGQHRHDTDAVTLARLEENRVKHIAAVLKWNTEHKEQCDEYKKKYRKRPEVRARAIEAMHRYLNSDVPEEAADRKLRVNELVRLSYYRKHRPEVVSDYLAHITEQQRLRLADINHVTVKFDLPKKAS